jgi:predicted N-acyltransferase
MSYDVKTFKAIDEIEPEKWDRISTTVFTQHACLKEIEKLSEININPRYVVVERNGKIVAAVALYIESDAEYFTLEESVFGKYYRFLRPLYLGLNPCLISYIPLGTVFKSIEVDPALKAEERIYQLVVNAMEKIAKDEGLSQYGFLCITADEDTLRKVLEKNKFVKKFASFAVYMDIVWKSFDEYLASFKSKQRYTIKNELAKQKTNHIHTYHYSTLGDDKDEVIKLCNENFYKYQKRKSKTNSEFLQAVNKTLKNNIGLIVDKKDNQVVSCNMYFTWKDTLSLFKVGQNYQLSEGSYSLFNVTVYEPVKIAIKEGYRRIYNGGGAYQYKLLRGAKLKPLYIYLKSTSKMKQTFLKLTFPILSRMKLKKHQRLTGKHSK